MTTFKTVAMLNERFQMALNSVLASSPRSSRRPVRVRRTGSLFDIRVDGRTMMAPGIRRWRMYRHGFDARLEQVARRYGLDDLRSADTDEWVLDIGAYMGEWSLLMLRRGFKVLAVEPDPAALACLKRNLERHAPAGSTWFADERVCIDDARETVTFFSEPTNADGSLFPSDKHISIPVERPCARLDDIVAGRLGAVRKIRAIKMDAEGAEPEVLAGAGEVLRDTSRIGIDAGAEREGAYTIEECRRILERAGFAVRTGPSYAIVTGEKSFSRSNPPFSTPRSSRSAAGNRAP